MEGLRIFQIRIGKFRSRGIGVDLVYQRFKVRWQRNHPSGNDVLVKVIDNAVLGIAIHIQRQQERLGGMNQGAVAVEIESAYAPAASVSSACSSFSSASTSKVATKSIITPRIPLCRWPFQTSRSGPSQ